jgi:long-chain fatty acid transport protein
MAYLLLKPTYKMETVMKDKVCRWVQLSVSALTLGAASNAFAVNGAYFTAYGASSSGMGGADIAFPQDTSNAADNPAAMSELGSVFDVYTSITPVSSNASFGTADNHLYSRAIILAPGFGVNYQVLPQWTFGVAVTGGGAASNYGVPVLPLPGAGVAKASLIFVNTAPTVTYKPLPNLSIGASLVVGVQELRLNGVIVPVDGGFEPLPSHGNSDATGIGGGLGVLWTPVAMITLGASYFTKVWYTAFPGYKGDVLTPSTGHLDEPSRFGVGVAIRPLPRVTVALDYLRINWASAAGYDTSTTFGYRNQNIGRIGVAYEVNDHWTVRAGYSFGNSVLDSAHAATNLYGPALGSRAATVGASYAIDKKNALTAAFEYDLPITVIGSGASTGSNFRASLQVYTLGYSHKF